MFHWILSYDCPLLTTYALDHSKFLNSINQIDPRSPKICFGTVKLPFSAKAGRWFAQRISCVTGHKSNMTIIATDRETRQTCCKPRLSAPSCVLQWCECSLSFVKPKRISFFFSAQMYAITARVHQTSDARDA